MYYVYILWNLHGTEYRSDLFIMKRACTKMMPPEGKSTLKPTMAKCF